MARPIVLSNGKLHVGLNEHGLVHDFFFPYVGLENHSAGHNMRHRVGVYVDGQMSWILNPDYSSDWICEFDYHKEALIGRTVARNDNIGIILEFDDLIDSDSNTFIRNVHIVNNSDRDREIRLFMHQAFAIGDSRSNTDTAQYIPNEDALLHYRGRRAFMISGYCNGEPFDQHTIGLFDIEGQQGTYFDAIDGELSENNVEHGRVDSAIRFKQNVKAHGSYRVHYWIACGMNIKDVSRINSKIKLEGVNKIIDRTEKWWNKWLKPGIEAAKSLDPKYQEAFIRSLMIIKSQIDSGGAIIASTDTSMLNYSRDAYAYNWPRDASFTIWPLLRIGYKEEAYKFFDFTSRCLQPSGYLMHKYRADGALGSSWHSYVHHDGTIAPPIQVDETALPVFMFAEYYKLYPEQEMIEEFYDSMIIPMADFLASYVDSATGLPKPSYDLWEEIFTTTTFTTATVYGALTAAADLAISIKDQHNSVKWRTAADEIRLAANKHLYNSDRKYFYKGVRAMGENIDRNDVIDTSSLFGAYIFGLFDSDGEEIKDSIETLKTTFNLSKDNLGIPRYENDNYRRENDNAASNQWFITSLWLAQYSIHNGHTSYATATIDWILSHALPTGVLGEQYNPNTGQMVSPAPLTWTHAELLSTFVDLTSY